MKLTLKNTAPKEVMVEVRVKFKDTDTWWLAEYKEGSPYGQMIHIAIPGRRPHEIEKIFLKYDNLEVEVPPLVGEDGEMLPIAIYDGDRDYWTNVLRAVAQGAKYVGANDSNGSNDAAGAGH